MRSRRKKTEIPGIAIILIFIIVIGLGLKGSGYAIRFFGTKQNTNTVEKTASVNTASNMDSSFGRLQPVENLSECQQMVVRKNLFEPLGGIKVEPKPIATPVAQVEPKKEPPITRPDPINDLVLTGIVYINNEPLALIEDNPKNKSYFLKKGDKLKDYVVEKIAKEGITLVNENSKITQILGSKTYYDTSGKLLTSGTSNIKTSVAVVSEPSNKPISSSNDNANLSLIEQMKARRKKELGQ